MENDDASPQSCELLNQIDEGCFDKWPGVQTHANIEQPAGSLRPVRQ
jgi:hypothetical protein